MSFSQTLRPEFEEEMKNTRKLLECVPDGKFDYQPHPKSMSLGRLATHVAELPGWTKEALDLEVLEIPADYKPTIATTRAELLQAFDKGVAAARERIAKATDADWQVTWTFKYGGQTIMSMPRAAVMRSVVMNHLIHHRAQLGVFLRLNDVAIPGMYGPSADEMKFWEPA
ncbi:MAG TPA: DinB family protein, partial [Candidatus Sulfopaludibacter sp.]|nr:DinB family protein [Candidatus Sulfopaludibacter sp.]